MEGGAGEPAEEEEFSFRFLLAGVLPISSLAVVDALVLASSEGPAVVEVAGDEGGSGELLRLKGKRESSEVMMRRTGHGKRDRGLKKRDEAG